jgi:hypothetical protein
MTVPQPTRYRPRQTIETALNRKLVSIYYGEFMVTPQTVPLPQAGILATLRSRIGWTAHVERPGVKA